MTCNAKKQLLIYKDPQAQTSTSVLKPVLEKSLPALDLNTADTVSFRAALTSGTTALAVIPGIASETSRYTDLIGDTQTLQSLHRFVRSGGILMTVCAGSYFISRETQYIPPWGPAKGRASTRPFFNAVARGPLSGLGAQAHSTAWHDGVTVVPVTYKDEKGTWKNTHIAYGNGPALFPDANEKNIEVLARFNSIAGTPIAAAWKPLGAGAVLWLGVLPYMGFDPAYENSGIAQIDSLMRNLKPHEDGRQDFWSALIAKMNAHIIKTAKEQKPGPQP